MEDNKKIDLSDLFISTKRTEKILLELLWRYILYNSKDELSAKESFNNAVQNIDVDLEEDASHLRSSK